MKHYQLSKYTNTSSSWTSVSDIGKVFENKVLSREEYLAVEDKYIEVLRSFLINGKCGDFSVIRFEDDRGDDRNGNRYFNIGDPYLKIRGGEILGVDTMLTFFRLCLREVTWIRLESKCGCYISFGYDFYVRLGVPDNMNIESEPITNLGLLLREMDEDPLE